MKTNCHNKKNRVLRTIVVLAAIALVPMRTNANPGDLYATDNVSVRKFAPNGTQTIFSSGLLRPRGLAFDRLTRLFGSTLDSTVRFDNQGRIVQYAADGTASTFASGLASTEQTSFDNNGNLYTGSAKSLSNGDPPDFVGVVYKIDPSANVSILTKLDPTTDHELFGLVVDRENNIFVADAFGKIWKINQGGGASVFAAVRPTPNTGPIGLAFDCAGNLFVSTSGDIGEIIKISPNGTQNTFATISTDTDLRGLVFDLAGNLFVAGHGSNNIYKVAPDGTVTVFATGLRVPQFFAVQPNIPTSKNQCKDGGWMALTDDRGCPFKNQGDCIQFANTGK